LVEGQLWVTEPVTCIGRCVGRTEPPSNQHYKKRTCGLGAIAPARRYHMVVRVMSAPLAFDHFTVTDHGEPVIRDAGKGGAIRPDLKSPRTS
jgi:hypothetical protein